MIITLRRISVFSFYRNRAARLKRVGLPALLVAVVALGMLSACGSDNASEPEASAGASSPAVSASPSSESAAAPSAETAASPSPETAAAAAYPQTFQDELGHEVTLPAAPTTVFAPAMEDSLLVLGVKPVAQWANGDIVPAYLQEQLGGVAKADFSAGLPSPETVASYKPDLIVLSNSYYAENGVYEQYAKIAPTYAFSQSSADLDGSLRKLGELLGKEQEAERALSDYKRKVEAARTKLAPVTEGKKALIIRMNARGMFLMGGDYYGGYVLAQELGFGKSKLVEKESSADLSLELLPELDADYIFIANHAGSGDAFHKELTDSPLWKNIPAVKEGRAFEVADDSWLNGGLIAGGNVIDEVVRLLAP
ncbi:hypothetical protein B1A99_23690 [Cohnella sp. CIP 111063]|nr:hypothetical protein B1A99_23690 [Cohnella sp. CIP 111063]